METKMPNGKKVGFIPYLLIAALIAVAALGGILIVTGH